MTALDQRIAFLGKFNPKFVIRYPCQSSPILPFGFLFSILLSSCFLVLFFLLAKHPIIWRNPNFREYPRGFSTFQTIPFKAANEVTLFTKRFLGVHKRENICCGSTSLLRTFHGNKIFFRNKCGEKCYHVCGAGLNISLYS